MKPTMRYVPGVGWDTPENHEHRALYELPKVTLAMSPWREEARVLARLIMDRWAGGADLEEEITKRIAAWMDTAAMFCLNADHWRERAEKAERAARGTLEVAE